jgi:hypothetical protein
MKKIVMLLVVIVMVGLAGGYFWWNKDWGGSEVVVGEEEQGGVGEEYVEAELGYSIRVPEGLRVVSEGEFSKRFVPDVEVVGVGEPNFVYVSVVTAENRDVNGVVYNYDPGQFEKLIGVENVGESVNLVEGDGPDMGEWFTYTVVAVEDLDQGRVKNFENNRPWEFPGGTTENRFIYGTDEKIFILGYYTGGDGVAEEALVDPRVAYGMIKSFKVLR